MNSRAGTASFALVAVACLALPATGYAQASEGSWTPPRTAWGDPDLQGIWNNNTVVPLQRPAELAARQELTAEEVAVRFHDRASSLFPQDHADSTTDTSLGPTRGGVSYNEFWFEWGQDTNRTSLIVDPPDGRLPAATPAEEARQRVRTDSYIGARFDSLEDFNAFDRCITRGLPGAMMPGFYNHNYHILQTPDYVALVVEMIHDARIIPLDGRGHAPAGIRQWLGDSRGRWEGDTLVIETTNFNAKILRRGGTVLGGDERLRVVERLRRVDADTIDYQVTVTDPTVWTAPWTASIPMNRRAEGTLFEYACHEGNYGLTNILTGARAAEEPSR
ncbi:MAG: hypothetical protein OXQ28_01125 [Acidobacteriota bacterium]|nr:hypothetical protein [Acidobacteriota bacterium]